MTDEVSADANNSTTIHKKKISISEIKKDMDIKDIFVIKFKKPVQQYANGYRFELRLGDATGEIMLKYWGSKNQNRVQALYNSIRQDDVILVSGKSGEYNNNIDISCNEGVHQLKVLSPNQYEAEFIKRYDNIEAMWTELESILNTVENPEIRLILDAFISDPSWLIRFKHSPGSMYRHHACIGGLLKHSLAVVKICMTASANVPNLDKDLLISGSFLHDIGKMDELETSTHIKVSTKGHLMGHITLGAIEFDRRTINLEIPDHLKLKIANILLSHHGRLEYGSPKLPATPEAMVVYFADEIDSKSDAMTAWKTAASTEDEFAYSKDYGNIFLK